MSSEKSRRLMLIGSAIQSNPYEPGNYLTRAENYESLGFPDLAAGDAYKALLLSDEIRDDCGEYHEKVIEAIEETVSEFHGADGPRKSIYSVQSNHRNSLRTEISHDAGSNGDPGEDGDDEPRTSAYNLSVADNVARESFTILSRTLIKCGCIKSAYEFADRGHQAFPNDRLFVDVQQRILETYQTSQEQRTLDRSDGTAIDSVTELPEKGSVRREIYSWNEHEPDRFTEESLLELNGRLRQVAPKCEVRAVKLPLLHEKIARTEPCNGVPQEPVRSSPETAQPTVKQLGLFATEDVAPYETVLHERSILAANNRLFDVLCDACSAPLPPILPEAPPLPSCPDCEDTVFCSSICQSLALNLYHPAVCNKPDFDTLAKDPSPQASASALYLALLARALAMSQTQRLHPLDLVETKYLCGDFTPPDSSYVHSSSTSSTFTTSRHLPFTFHDNILAPLHILEKMDIDIFANGEICDPWVINTLYAKFRGTASARFTTDERRKGPEVCAVHPMWCLANHSCAPNVKWEWGGEITFEARGGRDIVVWGPEKGAVGVKREGGIRKGEEVLNHYCDVELEVGDRREWAVGSLGGMCMCDRCVWEDKNKKGGGGGGGGGT